MHKILLTLLTTMILFSSIFSQSIEFHIGKTNSNSAAIFSLRGEKLTFADSIFAANPGDFTYQNEKMNTGFYRLSIDKQKSITFLYDGNNIEIKADAENIPETIEIINSESNKIYYRFLKLNRDYKTKTELLQLIIARYPKDDNYYQTSIEKLNELQYNYRKFVDSVNNIDPDSYIARYVNASQLPIVDYKISIEEQIAFLKSHALDNVDFADDQLIYSDCFTNKSIEYLTYFRNPQLPMGILEKEFQKAVDTLLNKASINIFVYQHVADYLVDGFKKFGFDMVVDYIVENYVVKDDLCMDEETENSIQNRINQSKLLAPGKETPNFILPDINNKNIELYDIITDELLLIFYASWCPHCQELLPKINKLYNEKKSFEVVAVSLDEKKEDWINFVKENNLEWINLSDTKGWNSEAAKKYYVYATPTMFMLDADKNIINKPTNLIEIKSLLD